MYQDDYKSFYDERRQQTYAQDYASIRPEQHYPYEELKAFIDAYDLTQRKCLEIGSSGGFFQDMVEDHYGTDIADSLAQYYHKPYRFARGENYPFDDQMCTASAEKGISSFELSNSATSTPMMLFFGSHPMDLIVFRIRFICGPSWSEQEPLSLRNVDDFAFCCRWQARTKVISKLDDDEGSGPKRRSLNSVSPRL